MKQKSKYKTRMLPSYEREFKKIAKKDRLLALKVKEAVKRLRHNPSRSDLETHKVTISSLGRVNSSWVSGDVRILWVLQGGEVILLLRVGGHSGSSKVYK